MVHAKDEQLAVILFGATILTQSCAKRIHWQIKQSEIGKSSKQSSIGAKVLVSTSHKFIRMSAPRSRTLKIVYRAGEIGSWKVTIPHCRAGSAEFRSGNHVIRVRLSLLG